MQRLFEKKSCQYSPWACMVYVCVCLWVFGSLFVSFCVCVCGRVGICLCPCRYTYLYCMSVYVFVCLYCMNMCLCVCVCACLQCSPCRPLCEGLPTVLWLPMGRAWSLSSSISTFCKTRWLFIWKYEKKHFGKKNILNISEGWKPLTKAARAKSSFKWLQLKGL